MYTHFYDTWLILAPWIGVLSLWELVWKGIAMWRAGRNNHKAWYICILIFNTVGILPILYLAFFSKKIEKK